VSALAKALLDDLGPDDLEWLAERLAPYLPMAPANDGWLTTREAAAYAGCSVAALHKAIARREVTFEQNGPGGKAWFTRGDLDAWRRRA
jgi:excisionase family DNA binding protein